ncbi:MAG: hydrogenase maturation protease [Deltaproteobacteria bacterium]
MKRISVVGVGNLLQRDDGIGVHVVRYLEEQGVPAGVELIDGGTHSYDLLDFFAEADIIIVVDAIQAGAEPGTIYRAPLDELGLQPNTDAATSLHDLNFIEAVHMLRLMGHDPQFIVFGVQPKEFRLDLELSPEVTATVPRVAELIQEEIQRIINE